MAAIQGFYQKEQNRPHFPDWLRHAKPLVRLKPLREILGLDSPHVVPERRAADTASVAKPAENVEVPVDDRPQIEDVTAGAERESGSVPASEVLVGTTRNRSADGLTR